MDITAIDIIGFLAAGLLVAAIIAVPLTIFYAIRTALRKPKPASVQMGLLEFCTSDKQVAPREAFYERCYKAILRETTKKRIVK